MTKIQSLLQEFQEFALKHKPLEENEYAETYFRAYDKGGWTVLCEKFRNDIPPDEFSWAISSLRPTDKFLFCEPISEWHKEMKMFYDRIVEILG